MKLDPRIEKDTLIYTPISYANINLNENGYFANDIKAFSDLDNCKYGELVYCDLDLDYPYLRRADMNRYAFYIPESSLKPVEKKYRPYTLDELPIKVCDIIYLKNKNSEIIERCLCISISSEGNQIKLITLGINSYSIQELFENYVWRHSDLWDFQPFGVEE